MSLPAFMATTRGQQTLPSVIVTGLLFLAVMLVWLGALAGPFQFDDHNVITGYDPVHSLAGWWQSLPGIRPLLKLSYALNWTLSPSPWGFHLFNLLLHLGNGFLLWRWAQRVLPLPATMALLLTALWLLHPVQTEAVTYISGRSVSLSTTFLLAGLLALAREQRHAAIRAALFTLLGLAVRETAWIFPLVFALQEFLRGKSGKELWRGIGPSLLVVAMSAAVFLCEPHYRYLVDSSFSARGIGSQLRGQLLAHAYLWQQLVLPDPNIDPDLRVPLQWNAWLLVQCLFGCCVLVLSVFFVLRRRSWMAAGLLWFFILLLPTNSLMPRLDLASDRHLYAALAGPLWALLLVLARWRYGHVLAVLLMLAYATGVLLRNEDYRSAMALWARTAQQSPEKPRVWNNLGVACRDAGETACAEMAFRRAMVLDPAYTTPAVNLYFLQKRK